MMICALSSIEFNIRLCVFQDHMWWLYSWFWGFDSWVPGAPDSDVPADFFPQTKCALGAPKGAPVEASKAALEEQAEWDTRIFEDRQKMLPVICRQPAVLEARLGALISALKSTPKP